MDQPWRVRTKLIQGPPGPGKYLQGTTQETPAWTGVDAAPFTVAVPAAVVGNPVEATCDQALGPVFVGAQVTAAGVVTISLVWLGSGSPPALTNANWTVYVLVNS